MRNLQLQPDLSCVPDSSSAPCSSEMMRDRVARSSRGLTRSDVNDGPLVVIHGGDRPAPSAVAPTMPVAHVRTSTRRPCGGVMAAGLPRWGSARLSSGNLVGSSVVAPDRFSCEEATPRPLLTAATGSLGLTALGRASCRRRRVRLGSVVEATPTACPFVVQLRTPASGVAAEGCPSGDLSAVVRRAMSKAAVGVTTGGDPDGAALRVVSWERPRPEVTVAGGTGEGDRRTAAMPSGMDMAAGPGRTGEGDVQLHGHVRWSRHGRALPHR